MLKNFTVIDILNTRSKSVVNIHGDTLRFNPQTAVELGYPKYVEFLVNTREKQFAIRPCKEDNQNAVPFCKGEEKKKVFVTSSVIVGLLRRMEGWGPEESWNMPGIYDFDENALAYSLKAAEVPQPGKGGWPAKRQKEVVAKAAAEE